MRRRVPSWAARDIRKVSRDLNWPLAVRYDDKTLLEALRTAYEDGACDGVNMTLRKIAKTLGPKESKNEQD
jgi:hypothetical protein